MHHLCVVPMIFLFVGEACAQPVVPPLPSNSRQPIIREAYIRPGCLLPSPEDIGSVGPGSVEMLIDVSEDGHSLKSVVTRSSGDSARDAAFQHAVMNCTFVPAIGYNLATGERKSVDGKYRLMYSWVAQQKFIGVGRCFLPDYPEAAQRFQEEADILVYFRRLNRDSDFEFRITSASQNRVLRQASLDAARQCLLHPEAQAGLLFDQWYSVPFSWRL